MLGVINALEQQQIFDVPPNVLFREIVMFQLTFLEIFTCKPKQINCNY